MPELNPEKDQSDEIIVDQSTVETYGETDFFREMVENVSDGLLAIDESSTIVFANPAIQRIFGYSPSELVGESLLTLIPEEDRKQHLTEMQRYLETGEQSLDWDAIELPGRHKDGHRIDLSISFRERVQRDEHLFIGIIREITERKQRLKELERNSAVLDAVGEAMYQLDLDGKFVAVNNVIVEKTGYSREELIGAPATRLLGAEDIERTNEVIRELLTDDKKELGVVRINIQTAEGETIPAEARIALMRIDGEVTGTAGIIRDISNRKRWVRKLKKLQSRYEVVVRTSTDAFWDWNLETDEVTRSENYLSEFGYKSSDWGSSIDWWKERVHPDDRARVLNAVETVLDEPDSQYDETYRFQKRDGTYGYVRSRGHVIFNDAGDPERMIGAHIDITDSKEHEQAVKALHRASREMMRAPDRQRVADCAVKASEKILDMPVCALWFYLPEYSRLEPVAWTDDATTLLGEIPTFFAGEECLSWRVFESKEPQLIPDLYEEPRRYNPDTPLRSEIIVSIGNHGVINFGATEPDAFNETHVMLAQLLAANVQAALDRIDRMEMLRERTTQLEQQRNELEELNHINTTIRDVIRTLVTASTRDELERAVCERLAGSDAYVAAWIGKPQPSGLEVEPKSWAGVDEAPPGKIPISDEQTTSHEPTGKAISSGNVQVVRHILDKLDFGPWLEWAQKRGVKSVAVIPIAYGGTISGVLHLYADRNNGFTDRELAVLNELGETIALAINAVENKKLLHADTVAELKFKITDDRSFFVTLSRELSCDLELEGIVPAEENTYLYYITAHDVQPAALLELVDESAHIRNASVIKDYDDESLFLFEVTGASALKTLLDAGTRIKAGSIANGEGVIIVELSADSDTSSIVDAFQHAFPDTSLIAKREIDCSIQTNREFQEDVKQRLTEKQEAALEAAYRGGYFSRSRNISGSELAESFDVTPSTFHYHLQTGLNKVTGAVFDESSMS